MSLSKEGEAFVNGAEGCVRETRKGVLHDDDPHFSELFEALKNASAWQKVFSTPGVLEPVKREGAFRQRGGRVCAGNPEGCPA
ncbi:hypothetical protein, partial [Vescimonas sp.]